MKKKKHLTIDEKRDWLASVFRDETGEYSQSDKFKAMAEDTRLALLQAEKEEQPARPPGPPPGLFDQLPPPYAKE